VTHWSASLLGGHVRSQGIEVSDRSVGRILRDADLQPHRPQMYLVSHDEEFIMDNLSAHDTPDVNEWFDEHPRWTRHFTPKHASWLNQIECWFSILSRQLLGRGSFTSTDDLAAKIDAYVAWYLETDRPFRWSYRPKSWSS